jgi:hypothetical protein
MPTVIALGFVAPEDGRAALGNCLEDPILGRRGHGTIAGEVGIPIVPDDVSHFQRRAAHGCLSCGGSKGKVSSGLGIAVSAWGVTCK